MTNSRAKGARGERAWRDQLRDHGFKARRGQQFSGSPDSPDVVCPSMPLIHFEVKCVERLELGKAMDQAVSDAGTKIPVVVHKKNRGPWMVTMLSEDWFEIMKESIYVE